jgi:hypothetical protein
MKGQHDFIGQFVGLFFLLSALQPLLTQRQLEYARRHMLARIQQQRGSRIVLPVAANEIVMAPDAVLGPVDPQLGKYPAASLLKVVARKPAAEVDDEALILADVAEKAVRQVRESLREMLGRTQPREELSPVPYPRHVQP